MDHGGEMPVRVFESGAILQYLPEKFGAFLPATGAARAECLSWLFWQMGSAPFLGGALAISMPTHPPSSNTRSIATPWKSSASQLLERHDANDFDYRTQDKVGNIEVL
jgi:glutathione S-transferase